jgi:hypothetical protein
MTSLDEIAQAVLQWQCQHPLALRLGPQAVHSIGLVALPFVRAAEGAPPAAVPRWRFWARPSGGDRAAFSEAFIEGLSPEQVADFARRHGVEAAAGLEDWPLRRVAVDSELAEAAAGGWPYERWLATAAVDGPQGRQRVLVSLQDRIPLTVLGRRHWDRRRLAAAAALPTVVLATALALRPSPPPPAAPALVAGTVASAVASGPALSMTAASAPLPAAPAEPASSPEPASLPPPSPTPSVDVTASDSAAASAPLVDIRPRLGPLRASQSPRPPIGGSARPAAGDAPGETPSPASAAAHAAASAAAPAASTDPERPALRPVPAGSTPFALVSPGFAKREDAEAQLARMLDHAQKTVAPESRLQGEVLQTPQGWRAAVYPFASREEAALINATMVARGWKTRTVEF